MTIPMHRARRSSRALVVALWIGLTAALLVVGRALPWERAADAIAHARPAWLMGAAVANALIILVWTAEWTLIAPRAAGVVFRRMFECVAAMAAVLNSVPFFAGEATGAALLIDRARLTRGGAISVLAMDQLLSGIGKLAVLCATALVVPLPAWLRAGVFALSAGVLALLMVLLPLAHRWREFEAAMVSSRSRLRRALLPFAALGRHLDALRETRRVARIVGLALLKKGLELSAIVAVQIAFGLAATPATALVVLACVSVSNIAPIAPGNVGVYETAAFAGYRYSGVSADTALALAIVQHLCFLLPMLGIGYTVISLRQLAATTRASRAHTSPGDAR